jgi:4-hydroxyphenylacetate 3-monooxygenase
VAQYFQFTNLGSRDREAVFRLANDTAVSGFGSHQVLYARFFFGPPGILAARFYDLYDKDPLTERVERLLDES